MNITVNDLPISGKFKIVWCGHILHRFDGTGSGDIAPDIASLPVLNTYESNGYLIIEVPGAERYRVVQVTDDGTRSTVCNAMYLHYPVDVVCSNVLNVIDDDDTVRKIARHLVEITTMSGGIGYVTVYEGDRSGTGRQTGTDQYQRNEPLRSYLRFFPDTAKIRNGIIIIGE